MELKNRRVAIRIDDAQLRWQLSDLLTKKGAVVHRARDEDELRLFVDRLGVEVVVAEARPDRSRLIGKYLPNVPSRRLPCHTIQSHPN